MTRHSMYEMRLYILNPTKPYRDNENDYEGAWFVCPVEFEEIKEKLGINDYYGVADQVF